LDFAEKHELLEQKITNNITSSAIFSKGNNKPLNHTPIIEMKNTNIMYKGVPIIKDLTWTVKAGEKWHIRGRNGSGKTTLLSLITLDHPQSWNRSISVFGVERKPGKVNYFDTNKYIGFTSPELHALYPRHHTLFQTISTGYIVGSYIPPTVEQLGADKVKKIRDYMKLVGLDGQEEVEFGDVHVSTQKLVLLLRAIINDPKILILDEALSSMTDDDLIKGKCLIDRLNTTCLVIGHVDNEVPRCDRYILVNGARKGIYEIGDV
jgi:ABC-type molybdenum transport system ATPase subunit/photorepair protein PhrA